MAHHFTKENQHSAPPNPISSMLQLISPAFHPVASCHNIGKLTRLVHPDAWLSIRLIERARTDDLSLGRVIVNVHYYPEKAPERGPRETRQNGTV
jgi:hypothetical protein